MSKKIRYYISLGAGNHQIPLIKAAKEIGYHIIGIDQDLNAPGLSLCDIKIEESIYNYRKIAYKIASLGVDGDISGGFCASYGKSLLSWAFLTERLGLIGLSRTQTELLIDKLLVRKKIDQAEPVHSYFGQPKFVYYKSRLRKVDLDLLNYPIILKSRFGFAKKNIYICENYDDLKKFISIENLKKINMSVHEIIFEEIIEGDEIIVTGLIKDFEYNTILISGKKISTLPPFIDLEHFFPSPYSGKLKVLQEIHQKLVYILGIQTGPLVSEWKIKNGKFYLIELSPQVPGEYIGSFLIPQSIQYNFFKNLVNISTGNEIEPVKYPKKPKKTTVKYWDKKVPIDVWDISKEKAVFSKVLNNNPPDIIKNNNDRFGVMGFVEKGKKIKLDI
ncbi:MAG: ATP-grasp domain-containing protein [Spirochaetia bacterium]|nr:ATP-grasp domain-containing protein [Spirochaetia bacterium]